MSICSKATLLLVSLFMTGSAAAQMYQSLGVDNALMNRSSVRSQGLANSGVAMVGTDSYTMNPASLALTGFNDNVSLSFYPTSTRSESYFADNGGFAFVGVSALLGERLGFPQDMPFGVAYHYSNWSLGEVGYTNQIGEPIGTFEPHADIHTISLSIAQTRSLEISFGTALRLFRWTYGVESTSDWEYAFDLGLLARTTWQKSLGKSSTGAERSISITPALGAALLSLGPDWGLIQDAQKDHLPTTLRLGLSCEISRKLGNLSLLSLTPTAEMDHLFPYDQTTDARYGIEFGVAEIGYIRYGRIEDFDPYDRDASSWGFTLSTRGISKLAAGAHRAGTDATARGIMQRLAIEVAYAKYDDQNVWLYNETKFLSLTASYEL